eukprot:TRINITY_DN3757_c0_g1_i1.p1 TRINITY_DN3757_c0_g1~~TRINITY_DN3757_c0_g1_i1.p1  ORF type:complete len:483 (+),score=95.00 TRINITY_DN3757_c0_g1_i1:29-1450(+)
MECRLKSICVVDVNSGRVEGDWLKLEKVLGDSLDDALRTCVLQALPPLDLKKTEEFCYTELEGHNLFLVACFRQDYFFSKWVLMIISRPLYSYIKSVGETYVDAYFAMGNLEDYSVLELLLVSLNKRLQTLTTQHQEIIFQDIKTRDFLQKYGSHALLLIKGYMLSYNIYFYSPVPSVASGDVVAFSSLLPLFLSSLVSGKDFYDASASSLSSIFQFPIIANYKWYPFKMLDNSEHVPETPYILGSNALPPVSGHAKRPHLVVNCTNGQISISNPTVGNTVGISERDEIFMDWMLDIVRNFKTRGIVIKKEGSDSWIRDMFTNYLRSFFSVLCAAPPTLESYAPFNSQFVLEWQKTDAHKHFISTCDKLAVVNDTSPTHVAANIKTLFNEIEAVVGPRVSQLSEFVASFRSKEETPKPQKSVGFFDSLKSTASRIVAASEEVLKSPPPVTVLTEKHLELEGSDSDGAYHVEEF